MNKKLNKDKRLADDKLYAEIYMKAVEYLGKIDGGRRGDTAAVELRIGGLYALESLALKAVDYKEIVMNVVPFYIRENARRPQRESSSPNTPNKRVSSLGVALPEDVVVAFRVLNDLAKRLEWNTPIDFEHADFERVNFDRVDFPNCKLNLRFAKLNDAILLGKMMNGADLFSAQLNSADLRDAQLNESLSILVFNRLLNKLDINKKEQLQSLFEINYNTNWGKIQTALKDFIFNESRIKKSIANQAIKNVVRLSEADFEKFLNNAF